MKFDEFIVGEITIEGAKEVCEKLISRHANKNISIFLSSEGGDPNGALTMGSAIQAVQRQGKTVHIHVGGTAYSAGVLLLQFADRRTIEPYTSMLIHPHTVLPESKQRLTLSNLNGLTEDLSFTEHCYFEILNRRTGFDVFEILNKAHYRNQEILLLPRDCLKWNLVDEVLSYALPECNQKTRTPGDDSIDNVILLDIQPATQNNGKRKRRRSS